MTYIYIYICFRFFKDELGSSTLVEIMALRTKCYMLRALASKHLSDAELLKFIDISVKCKGARLNKQAEAKNALRSSFVKALLESTKESVEFYRFASRNQKMTMVHETKSCIASFCDKRKLCSCLIHTVSHGFTTDRNPPCPVPQECRFLIKYFTLLYGSSKAKN